MWDGALRILNEIARRGPKSVFCNRKNKAGHCYTARVTVPRDLVGERVYVVTLREYEELRGHIESMMALRNFFSVLLNSRKGSKMFNIVGETWNPVTGCPHNCRYCWARKLALTKLKYSRRYRDGFNTRFNPEELKKSFRGGVVFVSDMGDLFADTVKDEWILKVLEHTAKFPDTYFLYLTKNPERYRDFLDVFPPNSILGATIETDDDDLYLEHHVSGAPLPSRRIKAMKSLSWSLKFVSIEPILNFTEKFPWHIREILPFMVYVGYDNYNNRLPEPPLKKTKKLIEDLAQFTLVIKKTIRPAWYENIEGYIEGKMVAEH